MEIELASFGRALFYLGVPFVIMVFYFQWRWAKTCDNNIRVLIAEKGGGARWMLAPKEGGKVTIHNTDTDEDRVWPVNELATIDVLYPGVGFVPAFMQKSIRLAILNEGDWEPLLNRSPHRQKIASPDVVNFIRALGKRSDATAKTKEAIESFLNGVSTGPTREMVADPATLGNLMRSVVLKALATVSNDLMDALKSINTRLARFAGLNATIIYIGLGLILILNAFAIYQLMQVAPSLAEASEIAPKIDAIQKALGIE